MADITIERVYDYRKGAEPAGALFLVDRMWPRGISKEDMADVTWAPDAAPSPNLRIWFGHRADRFDDFASRYRSELDARQDGTEPLLEAARSGPVTLLYAAKDTQVNHAQVLKSWLESELADQAR